MTDHTDDSHSSTDELWRWLLGGLLAGGIILGLLVAAYAAGYHSGQHHGRSAAPASTVPAPPTTTTGTSTGSTNSPPGPIVATPALVARGKSLYTSDGCSACHSLSGKAGAGPSLDAIVGRKVTLTSGETITSDDAYLVESIVSPDKKIVKGYGAGIMSAAIAGQDLATNPDDVKALVAFVKSQK
jgi:cytochrome c2